MAEPRVYHLPKFPLTVNLWREKLIPVGGSPDLVTSGQLRWLNRGTSQLQVISGLDIGATRTLYVPARFDVRPIPASHKPDVVEVPAGTGRFYFVIDVDDVARGFGNEFRCALLSVALFPVGPLT